MADTLQDLREDVLYHLGDPDHTIWTNNEVDSYILQGYDDLVRRTLILWNWDYSDDVASQAIYDLPSDLIVVDRVTWNNERIEPLVARRIRVADPNYTTKTGRVLGYLVEEDGVAHLRKYMIPSATATTGVDTNNTRIEYYRRGSTVSADADEFDVPRWATKYLRFFAQYLCLERKGRAQDLKLAEHYRQRYEIGIKRLKSRKQAVVSQRIGGWKSEMTRDARPPRPRMPHEYGRIVR